MSQKSIVAEITRFRKMSVGELREKWIELYGEPSRSRNREYLFKRCCWRLQEIRLGGLEPETKARLDQLADEHPTFTRARRPNGFDPDRLVNTTSPPVTTKRDPRLPTPGTVLTRQWHGSEIRVLVRDDGFEHDGAIHGSLSALARAVTGQRWNGKLFFGLTARKR